MTGIETLDRQEVLQTIARLEQERDAAKAGLREVTAQRDKSRLDVAKISGKLGACRLELKQVRGELVTAEQHKGRWHSPHNKLPDDYDSVLAIVRDGHHIKLAVVWYQSFLAGDEYQMSPAWYSEDLSTGTKSGIDADVIYWMRLPTQPEVQP